ncbi:MAG: hypothetical protein JZU63_04605, partial [Rhodoferax sp.]|nr:hypothetical protein [Rhodoferax sp.]
MCGPSTTVGIAIGIEGGEYLVAVAPVVFVIVVDSRAALSASLAPMVAHDERKFFHRRATMLGIIVARMFFLYFVSRVVVVVAVVICVVVAIV